MRGQNEKTKQNQTETAVTELIDQVEKFFSTRRFGSSTSTGGNSDLGNEKRASNTLWSAISLSQNGDPERRDKQNSDGPENQCAYEPP